MAKNIEPRLMSIGQYLKLVDDNVDDENKYSYKFVIPAYQRPYSWGYQQCDKLWTDIYEYCQDMRNKDSYFFGTIIINCIDGDSQYVLIDGQQRTTTFLLLLKALLISVNDILQTSNFPNEESFRLLRGLQNHRRRIMQILYRASPEDVQDNPDKSKDCDIYKKFSCPIQNQSINENEEYKNELSNILSAFDFEDAEKGAFKIKYKQKDNKYTNYFRNFRFFYDKVFMLDSTILNSLVKCILDNCQIIQIKSWQINQAISMFNSLNSDGMPLSDSDIISARFFEEANQLGESEKFKQKWSELRENVNSIDKTTISIDSILMQYMYVTKTRLDGKLDTTLPSIRNYYLDKQSQLINKPIESCEQLLHISNAWKKYAEIPALQIVIKFNENSKLFLGSYFSRDCEPNEEEIISISETMLRLFAVLRLVETGYSSKNFKYFLFQEEAKFIDSKVSIDEIKKDFSDHIRDIWITTKDDLMETLKSSDDNLFVYLNEYLFAKEQRFDFKLAGCDIEHIMSRKSYMTDAGICDNDEFCAYVNKLGNKILLEYSINRSLGNEWFSFKVQSKISDRSGYQNSSYPMAQYLVEKYKGVDKPYWTKEDIDEATEIATKRIIDFIFE